MRAAQRCPLKIRKKNQQTNHFPPERVSKVLPDSAEVSDMLSPHYFSSAPCRHLADLCGTSLRAPAFVCSRLSQVGSIHTRKTESSCFSSVSCFQFTESYRDPLKFTSENRSSKTAISSEASIIWGVFLLNPKQGSPVAIVTADWQIPALSIHPLSLSPRTLEGSFLKAVGCTGPPICC